MPTIVSSIAIYFLTMFIGKKAVALGWRDPDRKSSLWVVGELFNILLLFSIMLAPIIIFNLDVLPHMALSVVPIGIQFYVIKKYFYQDLRSSMSESKNA